MEFTTIINQIVFLAILAFCGIIATRVKIITEFSREAIEKLVFYITLPF